MFVLTTEDNAKLKTILTDCNLTPVSMDKNVRLKKDCGSNCSGHCGASCQAACKSTCSALF